MTSIPITFTHNNKTHSGHLSEVSGAGAQVWHLMVNNYYWGVLSKTERGWSFHGNKTVDEETLNHFIDVVVAWYE